MVNASASRVPGGFPAAAVRLIAVAMVLLGLALTPATAVAQGLDPAYTEFYDTLDAHGEWIEHPRYGQTWLPHAGEDRGWRPYSRGQWVYTEEHGWYWESEEEFGWVVYHYGRWLLDQRYGWLWVPGREWGPAWVAWREGEEAIGWAPLPPEAEFDGQVDGAYTFDTLDQPRYAPMWMFVAPAMLALPMVYRHFYPPNRSTYYFGRSRFATFYSFRDRRVFNRGIDRRVIERHSSRPVPVLQIRPMNTPRDLGRGRGGTERGAIGIYRPQFAAPTPGRDPRPRQPDGFGQRGPGSSGAPGRAAVQPQSPEQQVPPNARAAPGMPPAPGEGRFGRDDRSPFGNDNRPRMGDRTPPSAPTPRAEPQQQPPQQSPRQQMPPGGFGGGRNGFPQMGQPPPSQAMPPRPQVQQAPPPPRPQVQAPPPQRPQVQAPPPQRPPAPPAPAAKKPPSGPPGAPPAPDGAVPPRGR